MKKSIKDSILNYVAKLALNAAKSAAGSASWVGCYQPKEPKSLKDIRKA